MSPCEGKKETRTFIVSRAHIELPTFIPKKPGVGLSVGMIVPDIGASVHIVVFRLHLLYSWRIATFFLRTVGYVTFSSRIGTILSDHIVLLYTQSP